MGILNVPVQLVGHNTALLFGALGILADMIASGWLLWINKSGAPGAPITIKAQNQGMAVLDCGNSYNGPQSGCIGYIYFGDPGPGYWVLNSAERVGVPEHVLRCH